MVTSDAFAEFLGEQLASVGHITMRRMFGKTGGFCDGVMLSMVTENTSISESMIRTGRRSGRPSPFRLSTTRRRVAL
jgi:hypothetical protein